MVGTTAAAALTHDMSYNLPAKLWARWVWSLLKRFPQTAQAQSGIDIPVDCDYVKSDENRTQIDYCQQQVYKQGKNAFI